MADQREREGVLGLDPGQARPAASSTAVEAVALGQLARLGGDPAGDRLELVAAGQVVLDDDELLLQLDGDLHDRREDDDEGSVASCRRRCRESRAWTTSVRAEEAVEVAQHEQRRAVGRGQRRRAPGWRRAGRRARGPSVASRGPGVSQAAVDVPGGQGPALLAAEAGDLGDRVVMLDDWIQMPLNAARTNSYKRSESVMQKLLDKWRRGGEDGRDVAFSRDRLDPGSSRSRITVSGARAMYASQASPSCGSSSSSDSDPRRRSPASSQAGSAGGDAQQPRR